MLISLSLPVLVLAGGITGIPGLNWLKGFKVRRPPPAPADTLKPAWQTPSRLALENQFVRATLPPLSGGRLGLKLVPDPRRLEMDLEPEAGLVRATPEFGDVKLGESALMPLREYSGDLTRRSFQRQWRERSVEYIRTQSAGAAAAAATPGLSFKLPSPLPRQVQSLLGPGGPALNISGSENIRLSGQSSWTNLQITPLGRKQSLFPSLDMQQDLDIRLEGQLSDRIRVNLLQNSGIQVPLANRIAINYKGEEDDLVQALDLGNTNLTLPGTQYVSYSGKNEGLFGVKSSMRVGALDFTVLASKQEGRSERANYSGGASHQHSTLADIDYVRGQYFFLYDPNLDELQIENSDLRLYLDDYNYSNDQNSVPGRAFMDNGPTCAHYGDPTECDTTSVRGTFTLLHPGADQDYEILEMYGPRFKVIRLQRPVSGEQRLAASFAAHTLLAGDPRGAAFQVGSGDSLVSEPGDVPRIYMKLLRAPATLVRPNPENVFVRDSLFALTRDLELKNFYQLPGQRIDPATFTLTIQKGVDDPPVVSIVEPGGTTVPYLEVLGLDSYDQSQGSQVPGHDGKLDGTYLSAGSQQAFVDYDNGILFFPDPRPFAPRLRDPLFPFDQAVSKVLLRRDSLIGPPDAANGANVAIYDKYNPQRSQEVAYYMDVEFTAARAVGEINLGRGNLLEGSEVVSINGQALTRDRDYTIDYDLGRVVLRKQLGPADQLNVDYSYAPLFQQAGRTLLGNAFRLEGRDKSFGGAFMYESKGAQDLRPRLGEEPSRSLIGDLNTAWTFRPDWVTRLVDRLPGVRTTAGSEFNLQAEVGASFPNPNTRNEVYIDDMEGVRDAVGASMTPERWTWSAVPLRKGVGAEFDTLMTSVPGYHNAEIHWYSPVSAVKERDLKPNLTDAEGAQTSHPSLALSIPRRPCSAHNITNPCPDSASSTFDDVLWAGLTYPLDQVGLDLSRSQFIELWVNDFNDPRIRNELDPQSRNTKLRLHIDLGVVSEDQMRSPDVPPNGILDTEDRSDLGGAPDRQLDVSSGHNEDTGVDQLTDAEEKQAGIPIRDLVTANGDDPQGDDFKTVSEGPPEDMDPARFVHANGTEGNHNVNPNPDTEDLNLDNVRQTRDEYFEYTVALCDTCKTYLVTDVRRDFSGANVPYPPQANNGWRRYRIPIEDPGRVKFGNPDLTLARHLRVWVEGVVDPIPASEHRPLLLLGGLEVVGSRWQAAALSDSQETLGTKLTLNSLNTIDNAGEYVAPFDPGSDRSGGQAVTRREQSLALEFENLLPGDSLEAFRTFSIDENYSRYGQLNWFVSGTGIDDYTPGVTPLEYFVRFASDELGKNYYEYKAPVPQVASRISWDEIKLKLTDLSNLKLATDFPITDPILYSVPGPRGNDRITIRGRPSFTRLRRISFGIVNESAFPDSIIRKGKLLFDELRATEIAKDAGYAQRVLVNGKLANLLTYNATWNGRDANFQSVGESRGSGSSSDQLGLGTNIDLHRFFEGTGIVLPVGLSYSRSSSRPRFNAGDDVLRTGALEAASETRVENRGFTTSYARQWNDRSNPLLRYTLGGITANYSRTQSQGRNPNSVSEARGQNAAVSYGISPRSLLPIELPFTKTRFFPLPDRAYWNYSISTSEQKSFDRSRDGTQLLFRNAITGRTAFVNFGADTRPFEFLRHHVEGVRNLTLPENQREKLGFVNLGKVVTWRQSMEARSSLNRGPWLNPTLNWGSSYSQDNRPELSPDLRLRAIANSQTLGGSWALPFDRLAARVVQRSPADTSRSPRRSTVALWRDLLSRLGAVSADATYSQTSSYSRLLGTANPLYLMGLSDNPGLLPDNSGRMQTAFGNTINKGSDWRASARTRVNLGYDAAVATRGEYTWRRNEANRVASRTSTSRFPDLEVEYGRLPALVQLTRLFSQPRLRTAYSRSRETQYRIRESSPSSIATSSQWQPLLSLTGDFKNQTRAEFKVERRVRVAQNLEFGRSTRTDRNTDINLSLNRSYSRGQKVKVLGRESTIRSTVQLGLTAVYSRTSGETRTAGGRRGQLPVDQDRLSLNASSSYSFSSNVTGSMQLGFGQTRDLILATVSRNVRVELRASFTF
ncbi:MAG TPA: cell surface protein SprA [Candidatus Eisenbacteria bacterium]|jgi:hypothetical protein